MKVLIVGAGPAGLAAATLLAELGGSHDITVIERKAENVDPGWGVTLRTHALSFLDLNKALSPCLLNGRAFWYRGERVLSLVYPSTVGLATISRTALLQALLQRCQRAGARVLFETDGRTLDESDFANYDLVIAADGANSSIRAINAAAF